MDNALQLVSAGTFAGIDGPKQFFGIFASPLTLVAQATARPW